MRSAAQPRGAGTLGEGNRVILEAIEDWPQDFRACLGAWSEEIERPHQSTLDELRLENWA
jgi:hypothetical protein